MATPEGYDKPKVGGDILCHCSRCKMDLAHVVVAMLDGKPKRVACKTCKGEHAFRFSGIATRSAVSRRAAAPKVKKTTMLASEFWQKRIEERGSSAPKTYDPRQTFIVGDCIQHAKFGLGCIEEVRLAGKIVVIFRDGEKLLVHSLP